jgi:hypothetical protein
MVEKGLQWLAGDFSVLGVHLQNWMPFAAAILALAIVYIGRHK